MDQCWVPPDLPEGRAYFWRVHHTAEQQRMCCQEEEGKAGCVWPVLSGRFPNHLKSCLLPRNKWGEVGGARGQGSGTETQMEVPSPERHIWMRKLPSSPPSNKPLVWLKWLSLEKIRLQHKCVSTISTQFPGLWVLTLFLDNETHLFFFFLHFDTFQFANSGILDSILNPWVSVSSSMK